MSAEDYKHAGELGGLKDTKYWFKRDIGTFKKSFKKTIKLSPILLVVAVVLALGINYNDNSLVFESIAITTLSLFPIVLLGYFLFHVMVNKGYNIHSSGGGTVIDTSRNNKTS